MTRILSLLLFVVSFAANAQFGAYMMANGVGSGYVGSPTYIDSVAITEIQNAVTKAPTTAITRTDESITLHGEAYLAGVSVSTIVAYSWSVVETYTGVEVATGSSKNITLSSMSLGDYSIRLTATSSGTVKALFVNGLVVKRPSFTEGEADLVIDLTQLRAGTWTNPLGNLDDTQGVNSILEFNDVVRAGFKIGLKGDFVAGRSITWRGLKGTEASPVQIQNVDSDPVQISSNFDGVLWYWQDGNQYFSVDGIESSGEKGIQLIGRTSSGTQSQLMYFIGDSIKGIEVSGVLFNQNRGNGASDGGAAFQFSTVHDGGGNNATEFCNGTIGDDGYWTAEYFRSYNNTFKRCWDECQYIGYFSDSNGTNGYRPYRTGFVQVFRNSMDTTGRDFIQYSSSDSSLVVENYGIHNALEASSSHTSAVSFNDGNRGDNFVAFNYFEEIEMFTSAQNGFTGDGNYYFYSNFAKQRSTALITLNQFLFLKIEANIACHYTVTNNTFICPDVVVAPVCLQHDLGGTYFDANFKYAYNVMSTSGTDQSPYAELRRIGTPSSSAGWLVDNIWRRTADESELLLDAGYRPASTSSPAFGGGGDVSSFGYLFPNIGVEGDTLLVNRGGSGTDFTAGAFSGFQLHIEN
jgi:hypothetical protein